MIEALIKDIHLKRQNSLNEFYTLLSKKTDEILNDEILLNDFLENGIYLQFTTTSDIISDVKFEFTYFTKTIINGEYDENYDNDESEYIKKIINYSFKDFKFKLINRVRHTNLKFTYRYRISVK